MLARILTLLFILSVYGSCSLDISFPERHALIYGVADYAGVNNDLKYTDDDALAMKALFESKGFTSVSLGIDTEASRSAIREALATMNIPRNSLFVFYFAGHGEEIGEDEYIIPSDAVIGESETYISDDELGSWLAGVQVNKKVVILDTCFSGGFIGEGYSVDAYPDNWDGGKLFSSSLAESIQRYLSSPSSSDIPYSEAIVMAASGSDEKAVEGPSAGGGHGYFTYGLLESSDRGDSNNDGYLSTLEMYAFASDYVTSSNYYLPHISGGPVDFILFNAD
jgi:uncharacterized caspase-like protein